MKRSYPTCLGCKYHYYLYLDDYCFNSGRVPGAGLKRRDSGPHLCRYFLKLVDQLLTESPDREGEVLEILTEEEFSLHLEGKAQDVIFKNYGEAIENAIKDSKGNPELTYCIDLIARGFIPGLARFKNGERII